VPSGDVQRIALASPDKTGGVALVCVLIEAAGQALIWRLTQTTKTILHLLLKIRIFIKTY
jgi:hypothetical protein